MQLECNGVTLEIGKEMKWNSFKALCLIML